MCVSDALSSLGCKNADKILIRGKGKRAAVSLSVCYKYYFNNVN